jgi:hypothetical protein
VNDERVSRWMGPIGLVALIALFVGFGVLGGDQPSENASGAAVVSWFNAHAGMRWAQIYVIGFGLTLVLLFVTSLSRILREASTTRGPWPNLVFAAGIIFVGGEVAVGGVNATVLLLAAHNHQYAIAHLANFVGQNSEITMIYGLALLNLTTGIAVLSGSTLRRWLGIVSVVIAVACVLGPIGLIGTLAAALWIPVLGFAVGSRAKHTATPNVTGVASPVGAGRP